MIKWLVLQDGSNVSVITALSEPAVIFLSQRTLSCMFHAGLRQVLGLNLIFCGFQSSNQAKKPKGGTETILYICQQPKGFHLSSPLAIYNIPQQLNTSTLLESYTSIYQQLITYVHFYLRT